MSSSPNAATAASAGFDFEQLTPPPAPKPVPRLEEAKTQAEALVVAAEREADRIREDARRAAIAEGYAAGRADALRELAPATEALAAALAAAREREVEAAERIERDAVGLSITIAQKVVAGAIAVEPERVLDVIRGALRAIVERESVVLQVNPDDLELVRDSLTEIAASLGGIDHLEVQGERRVERGGALLRTSVGEVDARVQTKLEKARAAVESELRA
jgi:flagellar biosynthesis/type III secretory pathway protein FliH